MAEMKVTITGVLIDLYGRTMSGPLKLVGDLVRSDVGVGGGPIIPPPGGGGDGKPPGTWGGAGEPFPTPPINLPPGYPGAPPHVEHPIVLPPTLPDVPAPPEGGTKPPPAGQGGWGFYDGRWGYFPGPGQAQPKG